MSDGGEHERHELDSTLHPGLRTGVLSSVLVLASLIALSRLDPHAPANEDLRLTWWTVAPLAIVAEVMTFNIEFRREVASFTFSEIPLVLGLLLASPRDLVIGRLVGELLFLTLKGRQPLRKLTLNLSSFLGEIVVLLAIHQALGRPLDPRDPRTWAVTLVAVCGAVTLGFVVVARAIRWHGGLLELRSVLSIGALTAPVNTGLALVVVILLGVQPWAVLLLGSVAAFLLFAYRSYSALTDRYASLSMLYDFTRLGSGAQTPDVVLGSILGQAKDLFRAERAVIWLADDRGGHLELSVDEHERTSRPLPSVTTALIAGWFGTRRDAVVVTHGAHDMAARQLAQRLRAPDLIAAPITESGAVVGLIAVTHRLGEMNEFRQQDGSMFATLAVHASVALENGRLIARLHEQARQREHESQHDALTGLPNRVLFADRLREAVGELAPGQTLAVALMDLDGFKEVNDTLGHHAGDEVLIEVAHRLSRALQPAPFVARLGGDEFAAIFPAGYDLAQLEQCGRSIRTHLSLPIPVEDVRVTLGISIGFAVAPRDGCDASTLLQRADVAMYAAKTGIGDGVRFYDPGTDTNTPRRLDLSSDLPSAIEHGEIELRYQPKVRLADGQVVGAEALARWRHPRYGFVAPDEFVPIAERSGSILPLTEFVLASAGRQAAQWQWAGLDWGVAVNLSMRNLLDVDLAATVGCSRTAASSPTA